MNFRNPGAGPWLVTELFSYGQRETAEEISARVGGGALTFQPFKNTTLILQGERDSRNWNRAVRQPPAGVRRWTWIVLPGRTGRIVPRRPPGGWLAVKRSCGRTATRTGAVAAEALRRR